MDYEKVSPEDFGKSLRGLGLNILVRDVHRTAAFLKDVFEVQVHRLSADFAIVLYRGQVLQLHRDGTYHANPLLDLLPENPPRGAGVEIRFFDTDPDAAIARAEAAGYVILQSPTDKPHGLREAYILCADGYAWVPSRPR
jgi:predicted enzyme related to lactoylglutathione lyase